MYQSPHSCDVCRLHARVSALGVRQAIVKELKNSQCLKEQKTLKLMFRKRLKKLKY